MTQKKSPLILFISLILGSILGLLGYIFFKDSLALQWINTNILQTLGQIFLRLLFMVVVPMLFSALVVGVYELGQHNGLKKVFQKTLLYTIIASLFSVVIGISLVQAFKPGQGVQIDSSVLQSQAEQVNKIASQAASSSSLTQIITSLIPKNPVEAAVKAFDGEMIALMVFALFFGIGLSLTHKEKSDLSPKMSTHTQTLHEAPHLIKVLEQIFAACLKIVDMAFKLAPIAVFSLMFQATYKYGPSLFTALLGYVFVVFLGLLLQQFAIYSFLLKFVAHINPWVFYKKCKDVYLFAFSTASSNATLPKSLELAENELKISPQVSRFVLTIGSTANQNGTALFEGVTVLFLAQVYGIHLGLDQQIQVVLMSVLAGIGTAGVPGGSLPLIMILLQSVGIPPEGLGLILGVDRLLDMARTTLNVSGDLVIAQLVDSQIKPKAE